MKQCYKCGETKLITLFSKDKSKRDGVQTACAQCKRIEMAKRRASPYGRSQNLISDARNSSKKRKLEINISRDWIEEKLNRGICELTGLPFDFTPSKNTYLNKFAPSLDRINSSKGYTKDNVRVVLCAVNLALGQYNDEEMLPILKAMITGIENAQKKPAAPVSAGDYIQGAVGAELGSVSTPWTWEDSHDPDNHSGAVCWEDFNYRTKKSSGDGMGHGGTEVGASKTLEGFKDYWQSREKTRRIVG